MKKSKLIAIIVSSLFSIIAIGCLCYLAGQHWGLKLGSSTGQSLCNISDTFNCDAVSASRFASFFGVPIALWGAISFLIYLLISVTGHWLSIERLRRHSYYLASFFVAMSIVMGIISVVFMSTYCLFCIATYLCSIVIFFCAKHLNEDGFSEVTSDMKYMIGPGKSYLAIYAVIPLFSFVVQDMTHGESLRKMNEIMSYVPSEWESQKMQDFQTEPTFILGASDSDAKMVIVEFADFLCPHCKFAAPTLKSFVKARKDVQLRFYNFPLSSECNSSIKGPNPHRCRLAKVALCGQSLAGKGHGVTAELFDKQGKYLSSNVIPEIAKLFSFSEEDLRACVESEATKASVMAQAEEGAKAKIRGTPSIFVNGKLLPYGVRLPFLNAVYLKIKGQN